MVHKHSSFVRVFFINILLGMYYAKYVRSIQSSSGNKGSTFCCVMKYFPNQMWPLVMTNYHITFD